MINKTPYQSLIDAIRLKYRESGLPQVSLDDVHCEMSNRYRTKGGLCSCNRTTKRVRIIPNSEMFGRIDEAARMDIIIHEFAHALEFLAYGNLSHSGTWNRIARTLGGSGEVKHEFQVKHNKVRRVVMTTSSGNLYVLTPQETKKYGVVSRVLSSYIGEIEVERDSHTYRWTYLKIEDLGNARMLKEQWKLVA